MRILDLVYKYAPRCQHEGYGPIDNQDLNFLLRTGLLYRLTTFLLLVCVIALSVMLYFKWSTTPTLKGRGLAFQL